MASTEDEDKEAFVPLQENSTRISIVSKEKQTESHSSLNGTNAREKFLEEAEENQSNEKSGWRRFAGMTLAMLCSLFFSMTVLLAKILNQSYNHHPFVITMYRYGGILVPSIPIAIYFQKFTDVQVFETVTGTGAWKNLLAYLMQGILGCTAIIFRFFSLQYIPVADSTVVLSSHTVLVVILAHFFVGEKCGVVSVIFAFITAIGVAVISRPPIISGKSEFDLHFLKGIGFALLALLCSGIFLILMRKIRKTHFSLMIIVGGTWGVFESGMLAVVLGVFTLPQSTSDWSLIGALAVLTFLGQICFVLAVKYENAGPLSIIRTSESIYAFLWQYIFLGIVPDLISIAGGALVITAVFGTGYCKYLASLPIHNPMRKRFEFLLR